MEKVASVVGVRYEVQGRYIAAGAKVPWDTYVVVLGTLTMARAMKRANARAWGAEAEFRVVRVTVEVVEDD